MVYRTFYVVLAMIPVIVVLELLDASTAMRGLVLASVSAVLFTIALRWRRPQ